MKRTHLVLLIFLISGVTPSFTQTPGLSWEKQSGISGIDFFTDVIEDQNEGYTILGSQKNKANSFDLWIVRLNENGDSIWTKTLGTEHKDIPKKITQLSNKSYIVLGTVEKENQLLPFLVKIDEKGDEQWRKYWRATTILWFRI